MLTRAQNRRLAGGACLLVGLVAGSIEPKERMSRSLGLADGLPVARVSALAQDADGFVWIGTEGGLVRYDGLEMRQWAVDVLRRVFKVTANTSGDVVAAGTLPGRAYWIVPEGHRSLDGPDGEPLTTIRDLEFSSDGALWVVDADDLHVRTVA